MSAHARAVPKVLLSCLLFCVAAAAAAPASAGVLYLMGGGYSDTNTDLFVNGLRRATGKDLAFTPNINSTSNCGSNWATTTCPRIAVVTAASADYATGADAFANDLLTSSGAVSKRGYANLFQTHGFAPRHITAHVDNAGTHAYSGNAAGDANIAIINQADVVFFSGGDQSRIARTFMTGNGSDTPLAAALRARWANGSGAIVIAGDSAGNHILNVTMHGAGISYGYLYFGADLQAKTVATSNPFGDTREGSTSLRYFDNGATLKGLGFLPASLLSDTHFDSRSGRLGRLIAAQRALGITQGFGVDEDTGFLVDPAAQTGKVFGSGTVIISDTAAASVSSGTYYKVSGVRVSLLSAGDSYSYASKTVTSTKAAISSRYYSGYYDSADIFAANETSKSLTRVVDQSGSYNVGSAPAPRYTSNPKYPTGAPTIKVRFTRDATTRGWYSGGKYTVSKVLVEVY